MSAKFAPLLELTPAERLQLIEDLWESLADEDLNAPIPEWKLEALRQSKQQYHENPESGFTWEQVKESARASRRMATA